MREAATRAGIFWTVDGALARSACVAGRRRGGRFRERDERSCDDELDVGARGNAATQAPRSSQGDGTTIAGYERKNPPNESQAA